MRWMTSATRGAVSAPVTRPSSCQRETSAVMWERSIR